MVPNPTMGLKHLQACNANTVTEADPSRPSETEQVLPGDVTFLREGSMGWKHKLLPEDKGL